MKATPAMLAVLGLLRITPCWSQSTTTAYFSSIHKLDDAYAITTSARSNSPVLHQRLFVLYPLAKEISWSTVNQATKVTFTNNGLRKKAFFLADGSLSYTLTHYTEEQLPAELLRNIYQTYKNYKIHSIKEIVAQNTHTFYVIIENSKFYKTLKISQNQIEQIKKLKKGLADSELN